MMTCPQCKSCSTQKKAARKKWRWNSRHVLWLLRSLFCTRSYPYLPSSVFLSSSLSLLLCYPSLCPSICVLLPLPCLECGKWNQIWLWVSGQSLSCLSISLCRTCLPDHTAKKQYTTTQTHSGTPTHTQIHTQLHPHTATQFPVKLVVYVHKFDAPLYNVIWRVFRLFLWKYSKIWIWIHIPHFTQDYL